MIRGSTGGEKLTDEEIVDQASLYCVHICCEIDKAGIADSMQCHMLMGVRCICSDCIRFLQCIALALAGYETFVAALCTTLHYLPLYPEVSSRQLVIVSLQ